MGLKGVRHGPDRVGVLCLFGGERCGEAVQRRSELPLCSILFLLIVVNEAELLRYKVPVDAFYSILLDLNKGKLVERIHGLLNLVSRLSSRVASPGTD